MVLEEVENLNRLLNINEIEMVHKDLALPQMQAQMGLQVYFARLSRKSNFSSYTSYCRN